MYRMELNINEQKLLSDYIKTLERINHLNVLKNNFLKIPYLENFILKLSKINDDEILIEKILNKLNNKIISNEDICFSVLYYYNLESNEKKKIQYFIYNESEENLMILLKLKTNIILFIIKYLQFYYIINELLFDQKNINDDNDDNNDNLNELFYCLYLFINSKKYQKQLIKFSKKNIKMKIINILFNELFNIYLKIYDIFEKNELIKINNDIEKFNYFINKILQPWFNHYKKYIENDELNNIIQKFENKKKNIFDHIMCFNTICH